MIGILISMIGGVMAATSLIVKIKPSFKESLAKLVPFQGIAGLVLLGWGVWNVFNLVRYFLSGGFDLFSTATVAMQLIVGFMLSFGLINQLLSSKSVASAEKGEKLMMKLAGFQGIFGLILIGLSLVSLFRTI